MADKEKIYEEIKKCSQNNEISCRQCFEIAKDNNVAVKIIGEICNEYRIKVRTCQMGLFK